jgi:hypothetical protein
MGFVDMPEPEVIKQQAQFFIEVFEVAYLVIPLLRGYAGDVVLLPEQVLFPDVDTDPAGQQKDQ